MNKEDSVFGSTHAKANRTVRQARSLFGIMALTAMACLIWLVARQQAHEAAADRERLVYAVADYAGSRRPYPTDLKAYLSLVHNSPPYKILMHGPNSAQVSFDVSTKNVVSDRPLQPISESIVVTAYRKASGEWEGIDEIKTKHPL